MNEGGNFTQFPPDKNPLYLDLPARAYYGQAARIVDIDGDGYLEAVMVAGTPRTVWKKAINGSGRTTVVLVAAAWSGVRASWQVVAACFAAAGLLGHSAP